MLPKLLQISSRHPLSTCTRKFVGHENSMLSIARGVASPSCQWACSLRQLATELVSQAPEESQKAVPSTLQARLTLYSSSTLYEACSSGLHSLSNFPR